MNALTSLELRRAIRAKFAWPGGYDLIFVCSDGACLCADCARKEYRQIAYSRRHNLRDGWSVESISAGCDTDESTCCAHCNKELSAYVE